MFIGQDPLFSKTILYSDSRLNDLRKTAGMMHQKQNNTQHVVQLPQLPEFIILIATALPLVLPTTAEHVGGEGVHVDRRHVTLTGGVRGTSETQDPETQFPVGA